ncbi:MAG: FemAB family protein [Nitrospira sp.]|nr:FemAB family protein [Nitrospira sp.]
MERSGHTALPPYLKDVISAAAMCAEFRVGQQTRWDAALEQLPYIPVAYTNASIDYQLAYQQGHGGEWWDISMIVFWDNRPSAVWPLSFSLKDGKGNLSSHGLPVITPQVVPACAVSSRKRIAKGCLDLADAIAKAAGLNVWSSAEPFSESTGLGEWHIDAMARDADCAVRHDLFLDLRPDMAEIKRNIRSSYKSLITGGMRIWSVGVLDSAEQSIWDEFRQLHLRVSGRKTRSDESWALQLEDIGHHYAFLVYLRNSDGEMVGGGLFNFTRDEGVYAVGVYDRSLFDKPLGHVVQYRAIEELKKRGVRWYKIGARPYLSETPPPTDKEVSIGEFKQGFASHVFPQYQLTHKV